MQNRLQHAEATRLEVAVACAVSVPLGIAALIITGMAAVVVVPVTGFAVLVAIPVLLYLAAAGGAWLLVRGELPAKGFGAGVLIGWVLVALWSSGASTGLGVPS